MPENQVQEMAYRNDLEALRLAYEFGLFENIGQAQDALKKTKKRYRGASHDRY